MCYDKPRRCSLATFSLLIFSLRTVVENGTHLLTYFVDRDPSLKSLISCLDLSGADYQPPFFQISNRVIFSDLSPLPTSPISSPHSR
ncbi:hypothetical protein ACFX2A_010293 [Malus domestica]